MFSSQKITFKSVAKSLMPDWELDDWIHWPPDMFALCSTIINRTGVYKLCLLDSAWWNTSTWQDDIDRLGDLWVKYSGNMLLDKRDYVDLRNREVFVDYYNILQKEWDQETVDLHQFRVLGNIYVKEPDATQLSAKELAKAILYLAILADTSCSGLGFLGQPLRKENRANRIFMAVANLHLNNTGSLSTVPKFHGIVLPKMRTPQAGMSARSLTFYLTFHSSEVEVIWRTFPRLDSGKKSLNIMAVPYPKKVEPTDFEIMADDFQPVRYFKGNIDGRKKDEDFLSKLAVKLGEMSVQKSPVDIVVFPEMSLTEDEYDFLLERLQFVFQGHNKNAEIPIIIAGTLKANTKATGYSDVDSTFHNEVRMGVFFSGRWFNTTQRKHHRWQLDRSQIQQYQLENYLNANDTWFEYCSIAQRRLTILSPNDWLGLTALICEDLARQEPVSEVIRGVGPTLLMALLSDGPQLKERWSARYASILADDPGTAVLSLTSSGMMNRSKSENMSHDEKTKPVIGLWKDMVRSWKELSLVGESDAIVFTVSAKYKTEFTLDGRSDGELAAVFQMDSHLPKQIDINGVDLPAHSVGYTKAKVVTDAGWNNIRELSALQFVTDAILDIVSDSNVTVKDKALASEMLFMLLEGKSIPLSKKYRFKNNISSNISNAWKDPGLLGIAASAGQKSTEEMEIAVKLLKECLDYALQSSGQTTTDLYKELIDICERQLAIVGGKFGDQQVSLSILYNLHNRISSWRPGDLSCCEISGLTVSEATGLKKKILAIIHH